jgi:NitT/TauT family transport system permease protein
MTWPMLTAFGLFVVVWQLVVWSGWKPKFVLPPPADVFAHLGEMFSTPRFWNAVTNTIGRAAIGFAVAILIGTALGLVVSQSRVMRRAIGSGLSGLQSMPSIAWFPLAILLFGLTETAILFVVVLGAAPSIANGLIGGVDTTPPILLRAGKVLGAKGWCSWRHVVLPAAMPGYVAGIKQGWAFAWRSLMAGELLVIIAAQPSLGVFLHQARELADADEVVATMIVIFVIGVVVDLVIFSNLERRLRRNRGLLTTT